MARTDLDSPQAQDDMILLLNSETGLGVNPQTILPLLEKFKPPFFDTACAQNQGILSRLEHWPVLAGHLNVKHLRWLFILV